MSPRRAERWVRRSLHPRGAPLLGFVGSTVPYWTLAGDRPSLAVAEATAGPEVRRTPGGWRCRFRFGGALYDLVLAHSTLATTLAGQGMSRFSVGGLHQVLGFPPRRVIVALTPPVDGYCHKVVAGLLPGR
jgi:hypothetical protein